MPIDVVKLAENLKRISGQIKEKSSSSSMFWRPTAQHKIRIVPTEPQFKEYKMHYDVDPEGSFVCPSTFNKSCPVCELRMKLYKEGDKETAGKLKSPWRFSVPIIVRSDDQKEETQVKWWSFSKKIYEDIINICKNPENGDISDPIKGIDLFISKNKAVTEGAYDTITLTTSRFSTPLAQSEEAIKKLIDNIPLIDDQFRKHSNEKLIEILEKWVENITATKGGSSQSATVERSLDHPGTEEGSDEENVDAIFDEIKQITKE